jgi:tyrosine-protein phosphatase SIW14
MGSPSTSAARCACLAVCAILGVAAFSHPQRARAAGPPDGCHEVAAQPPQTQPAPRGIINFGQVSPTLFRGGQPSTQGYRALKQMGVGLVVSFRVEKGDTTMERRAVEAQGMRFVSLPWRAWDGPSDENVRQFLALLASNPDTKVFVHCQQGRDRTGTMVALYREAVEHWCASSAVSEMKAYHYHHFFFPHLETYVETFPQRLTTDSRLASVAALNYTSH